MKTSRCVPWMPQKSPSSWNRTRVFACGDRAPQQAQTEEGWEPDTWIWDDQAVVIDVRGKGLVVLSSCSHSGVINVLRHARRITGIERIHAFIGGLHLTGGLFEPIISRTVDELK